MCKTVFRAYQKDSFELYVGGACRPNAPCSVRPGLTNWQQIKCFSIVYIKQLKYKSYLSLNSAVDKIRQLLHTYTPSQGIEDLLELEWKFAKFFSRMLPMLKISEELFTPFLNGCAVKVWYVSSTQVVLHAGLTDLLRHKKIILDHNEEVIKKKSVTLFLIEILILCFIQSGT